MILIIKTHFDAAHHLPDYNGKCRRVHGHRWELEVAFQGSVVEKTGMVFDFKKVKDTVKKVTEVFDHRDLNNFIPMPTAENIAQEIWDILPIWMDPQWLRLWESPDCSVLIRREDFDEKAS